MFDDPRSNDSRDRDEGRDRDSHDRDVDPRDVFMEGLDLPRGLERELVHDRDREYSLRGSESRALSVVGAFRVVSSRDLLDHHDRPADPRTGDLRHLREQGLIRTVPLHGHRDVAVVLTDRGRDLLESHRRDRDGGHDHSQEFYAELKKAREVEHDVQVYRAYEREAEQLQERGARIERVVLDYELKRDYQQFLQERNRGRADSDGRPDRDASEIADWAREHDLPYFDGHVHFPDARIEYEDAGRPLGSPGRRGRDAPLPWCARRCREPVGLFNIPRVERANRRLSLRSRCRRGAVPMTAEDRVRAIVDFGFTERQARFLVTVMLHSGVCLLRQYTGFAGIVHGQKTRKFFHKLVSRRYATVYPCRHNRGRVYHVHHKSLYRAIGETDSRHRRPMSAARVVDALTLLDAVLASPQLVWLATEEEKHVHLSSLAGITTDKLPHLTIAEGASNDVRMFPDKVPVGIDMNGRWVFVYLVTHDRQEDFYLFLHRHAALFSTLPAWTLRLVFPPPFGCLEPQYRNDFRYALATRRSNSGLVDDLRWYFKQRRAHGLEGTAIQDEERYYELKECLRATHYQVLYRRWLTEGEAALEVVSSEATADAIERGSGRVESYVLPFSYRHLTPLVGIARRSAGEADASAEHVSDTVR